MNGRNIRAGGAYVELFVRDKLQKGLNVAAARLKTFGAGVQAVGRNIFNVGAGMSAAGAAIVTPFVAAAKAFASTGDQLDKMRARSGISAQSLSGLGFAAEQGGASIDQLDRSLAAMARFSLQAERGLKTSTDTLDMLGISLDQFKSANAEERFKLMADAIAKVEDPTMKAGLALQVFGRSGRELLPMLSGGRAGIEALQQEAEALGITMSDDDATAAAALADAMNRLKRVGAALWTQFGAAAAGPLTEFYTAIARTGSNAVQWIKDNRGLLQTIFLVAAGVMGLGFVVSALGATVVATGAVISATGVVLGSLGGVLAAVISPIGLVIALIIAGGAALLYFSGIGGKVVSFLADRFGFLWQWISKVFGGIAAALKMGDIGAAAKIMWLALQVAWTSGIARLSVVWENFKNVSLRVFDELRFGVVRIFSAMLSKIAGLVKSAGDFLGMEKLANAAQAIEEFGRDTGAGAKMARDQNAANRQRESDKRLAELNREMANAQTELDAAVASAKAKASVPDFQPPEPTGTDQEGVGIEEAKGNIVGTFSGAAAARFSAVASPLDKRTAEASEKTAENTKTMSERLAELQMPQIT